MNGHPNANRRRSSWPAVVAGMAVMLLVPTLIVVGVLIGARGPDSPGVPAGVVPAVEADPRTVDDAAIPVAPARPTAGTVSRLDAHQAMLEQMRVSVTPQMIQTMNDDPLVHSPVDLAELERHADDIDRMLARDR